MKSNNLLILSVLVGLLSLYSITVNFNSDNIPQILVSIVGVTSTILFFSKNKHSALLTKIWIIAQIPYIVSESIAYVDNGINYVETINYWNTSQAFNIGLGLTLDDLEVKINLLPLLFLGYYRLLKVHRLIGLNIQLTKGLNRENKLGNIFPLNGEFISHIQFENKDKWMVTKLHNPIGLNGIEYENILLRPKEEGIFKLKSKQLAYLRLVKPEMEIDKLSTKKEDFPFVDYVGVKKNTLDK